MKPWKPAAVLGTAIIMLAPTSAPPHATAGTLDLDVGVPPGSPTTWGLRFPAITPSRKPLFPKTPRPGVRPGGTVAQMVRKNLDVEMSSSFGVVRILTWDLAAHLTWVQRPQTPRSKGPQTGAGKNVTRPRVPDGLYWASMAAMLRRLLHPQVVSESGIAAHLVELGAPVLPTLQNSSAERRLKPLADTVRRLLSEPAGSARPLAGKTPEATMWKRFLAQELVSHHPYDPEGGFGARIFPFAAQLEPYLVEYCRHPGSFLRRNAVAALSRYRSAAAIDELLDLAEKSKDPVVWARALAAAGTQRGISKVGGLVARLRGTKDRVEREALIAALGRIGATEAIPTLLSLASRRNPDAFLACALALARIPPGPHAAAVQKFAHDLVVASRSNPKQFAIARKGLPADVPDSRETRGNVLNQIALCIEARAGGKHAKTASESLLRLVLMGRIKGGRPARVVLFRGGNAFENETFPSLLPPSQMVVVETLGLLGLRGAQALERIARDSTADPAVRGHALAQLPLVKQGEVCDDLLGARATEDEIRIYALELLGQGNHAKIADHARKLLVAAGKGRSTEATSTRRYLWLQALRALASRGRLRHQDLVPLLKYARARTSRDAGPRQRLLSRVRALVADAIKRLTAKQTAARIDRLIEFAQVHRLRARLSKEAWKKLHKALRKRLDGLRGHRGDTRLHALVTQDIVQLLSGFRPALDLQSQASFQPLVQLEEEILLALGRLKSKEGVATLREFLRNSPSSPVRGHAALALGVSGKLPAASQLIPLLEGPDGFVRLCAYQSLRALTGRAYFADWLFGDAAAWRAAAERYRRLVGR